MGVKSSSPSRCAHPGLASPKECILGLIGEGKRGNARPETQLLRIANGNADHLCVGAQVWTENLVESEK